MTNSGRSKVEAISPPVTAAIRSIPDEGNEDKNRREMIGKRRKKRDKREEAIRWRGVRRFDILI